LLAKPVVNRLEDELGSQASVIRLDVLSSIGQTAGGQYGIRAVPTFLLMDGQGNLIYRQSGRIDTAKVKDLVSEIHERN
jgi:thioredoxin-related protein